MRSKKRQIQIPLEAFKYCFTPVLCSKGKIDSNFIILKGDWYIILTQEKYEVHIRNIKTGKNYITNINKLKKLWQEEKI